MPRWSSRMSIVILFILVIFSSLTFAESPKEITVSAAISLKNAFEEIGKLYELKVSGVKVFFNFGASGDLARQIEGGAPVDIFASAAQKDMDGLVSKGLVLQSSLFKAAANSIVLIVPAASKTALSSFEGLNANEVRKIAVGNPKTVPAGRYADEVFSYYKLLPFIQDKLVFTENVRQVLDYVSRGEVDAGIVYATDAAAKEKEIRIVANAPDASHKPAVYPIAVIKGSKNEEAAKAFVSLVLSPDGQNILEKYGFRKP